MAPGSRLGIQSAPIFLLAGSAAMPPIAPLVMSKGPKSFSPRPLAHLPRPAAFAPRQSSSLSREPRAGRATYSAERAFAQKAQPNTGLRHAHEVRTARSDRWRLLRLLLEVGQRMAIASRSARCKRFAKARCRSVFASD
jgi:hypothetical protein